MMQNERRLSIRKPLERLAYISLPLNNGGVVLDVSEGGVGFHAIAPVKANGPIQFRFAVDSARRIKAVGELAWLDETGKTGGLRFTELPEDVREHIRAWSGQSKTGVIDVPVAESKAGADVVPGSDANLAPTVDVPVREPEIHPSLAPGSNADMAPFFVNYPAAEPEGEPEVSSGMRINLAPRAAASPAPLYNLRPPVYSAPHYELSMFSTAAISNGMAYASEPRSPFPARHPIAALVLTIFLASVVGSGIFAYVSTTQAGDVLYYLGTRIRDGLQSQPVQKSSPPENFATDRAKPPQQ
jgi:PilZ domain